MTNEELIVLAKSGDKQAENQLFRQNKKFPHFMAGKFKNTSLDRGELVSLCTFGMMKAYKTFDSNKEIKFLTYAATCMNNEVLMMLRKRPYCPMVSLSDVSFTDKNNKELTVEDKIGEEDADYEKIETRETLRIIIEEFDEKATEYQKQVLSLRMEKEIEQREIAEILGISQSYVSRVEKQALNKLRKIAAKHGLQGSFIKGEVKDMSKVNIPSFIYLVKNYPDLKQVDLFRILGVSRSLISMYMKSYEKGKYDDVIPEPGNMDERVAEHIRNYYPEKLSGDVKTTYIEKLPPKNEVEVKQEYQSKEHKVEDTILPPQIEEVLRDKTLRDGVPIKHDVINRPSHYTAGGIEVIDYMQAKMTKEQFEGYLLGNVFKYTSRFQFKNGLEDLKKSHWYISKLIEVMESGSNL